MIYSWLVDFHFFAFRLFTFQNISSDLPSTDLGNEPRPSLNTCLLTRRQEHVNHPSILVTQMAARFSYKEVLYELTFSRLSYFLGLLCVLENNNQQMCWNVFHLNIFDVNDRKFKNSQNCQRYLKSWKYMYAKKHWRIWYMVDGW